VKIPRVLLIAVIVLLVLYVGSCAAPSSRDDGSGDSAQTSWVQALAAVAPAKRIGPGEFSTTCSEFSNQLVVGTIPCGVSIGSSDDGIRRLRLRVVAGTVQATKDGASQNVSATSDKPTLDIPVLSGKTADAALSCLTGGSCTLVID
jgi:hypothetical protein